MRQSLNLIEATIYNKIKKQSNIIIHIYYVNYKIDTNILSKHLFLLHNH